METKEQLLSPPIEVGMIVRNRKTGMLARVYSTEGTLMMEQIPDGYLFWPGEPRDFWDNYHLAPTAVAEIYQKPLTRSEVHEPETKTDEGQQLRHEEKSPPPYPLKFQEGDYLKDAKGSTFLVEGRSIHVSVLKNVSTGESITVRNEIAHEDFTHTTPPVFVGCRNVKVDNDTIRVTKTPKNGFDGRRINPLITDESGQWPDTIDYIKVDFSDVQEKKAKKAMESYLANIAYEIMQNLRVREIVLARIKEGRDVE